MASAYQNRKKLPTLLFLVLLIMFPRMIHASIPETQALLDFKKSLVNSQTALQSWVPKEDACQHPKDQWVGVVCSNGAVWGIHLKFMGLSGRIDVDALSRLAGLRSIDFEGNQFAGPIPPLNRLGTLKSIYLAKNQFSGEIPDDFFTRTGSLKKLWLSNNKFTGQIPLSVAQLPYLLELHLENNQFSGPIPPLRQPPLKSLNLSNNHLNGKIPVSLSEFNASSFQGNPNLCGPVSGKDCFLNDPDPDPIPGAPTAGATFSPIMTTEEELQNSNEMPGKLTRRGSLVAAISIGILVVICLLILLTLLIKSRKDGEKSPEKSVKSGRPTTFLEEAAVKVDIGAALSRKNKKGSSSSSRKSSRRGVGGGGIQGDGVENLTVVNQEKGTFQMADLMKASAEVLGNGGLGSAYKAVLGNGLGLAVKRMKELNRLDKGAFDAEIRKLASLRHPNVLAPLAYYYKNQEKFVISEYVAKGSLSYLLHGDRGVDSELDWPTRLEIVKGITRGLCYLHSQLSTYDLPHGNLKSSNILINSENKPFLSDYGFNIFANPNVAASSLFAYRSPEAIDQKLVTPKCDVFCLGVVILEILTGKYPSQYLANTKNGTDVVQWVASAIAEKRGDGVMDPEMMTSKSAGCKQSMMKLLHIGLACTEPDPNTRPDLSEVSQRIERVEVEETIGGLDDVHSIEDGFVDVDV